MTDLQQKVVSNAKSHGQGSFEGGGECYELVNAILKDSGAKNFYNYSKASDQRKHPFGKPATKYEAGNVIVIADAAIPHPIYRHDKKRYKNVSFPENGHVAVIIQAQNSAIWVVQQNIPNGANVTWMCVNMSKAVLGNRGFILLFEPEPLTAGN